MNQKENKNIETFIADIQDLSRITIPIQLVKILKIKKGQKIKLAILKIYK